MAVALLPTWLALNNIRISAVAEDELICLQNNNCKDCASCINNRYWKETVSVSLHWPAIRFS